MRWCWTVWPPSALLLLAPPAAAPGVPPLRPTPPADIDIEVTPEQYSFVGELVPKSPRCTARKRPAADPGRCGGSASDIIDLGKMGPKPEDALRGLHTAVAGAGAPCTLIPRGMARKVLHGTSIILLGDSTMGEDFAYWSWLLAPTGLGKQDAYDFFHSSTRMPEGAGRHKGQRQWWSWLPEEPANRDCTLMEPGLSADMNMSYCPGYRRGQVLVKGPDGKPGSAVLMRFNGASKWHGNWGGLHTFFKRRFWLEFREMVRRAVAWNHRIVLVVNSGPHDALHPTNAYLRAERAGGRAAGEAALQKYLATWRTQMEKVAAVLASFQQSGAHVIWRASNHGMDIQVPGAVPLQWHPAGQRPMLRRLDRVAREVFEKRVVPLGGQFFNTTEVTRVYYGDGGWEYRSRFNPVWYPGNQHPWKLPWDDGIHMGSVRWSPEKTMEVSALVVSGLLALAAQGCGTGAAPSAPEAGPR